MQQKYQTDAGQEGKNGLAGTVSIPVNTKYLRTFHLPLNHRQAVGLEVMVFPLHFWRK